MLLTLLMMTCAALPDGGAPLDGGAEPGERGEVIDGTSPDGGGEEPTAAAITPRVTVSVVGALAQLPAAYLEVVKLPANARPNAATAAVVQAQLEDFLKLRGYDLATVSVLVTEEGLEAHIDEGKIERIIILGRLSFQQVRFKLGLGLPYDVFNRDLLDRQVRELSKEFNTPGVRWELVRTSEIDHDGPQVKSLPGDLELVAGSRGIHELRPYEVRISFPEATGSYLGVDLRAYYIDGLEIGLNYTGRDLIFDDDLWYVAASGGVGFRMRIGTGDYYPYFSRASFEALYATPKIFKRFKPNLWSLTSVVSRQRPDLNLETYWAFTTAAALQLELELRTGMSFAIGAGYEYRLLFGYEAAPETDVPLVGQLSVRQRPFIRFTAETVINPRILRWDRRHTLETEARYYFPFESNRGFGWVDMKYQYVKELGWHDFWVKSRGHFSFGEVAFHDEISVGEFVRGIHTGEWVPSGVSVLLEFRFSLLRDVIKIGVFHDLGLFAVPLRTQGKLVAELGNGFGPSLSLLVLDMFQIDMFVGFGFRRNARFNAGFGLILNKAF